jgi:sugar lactone lactonase YvrE
VVSKVRQLAVPAAGDRVLALDSSGRVHRWQLTNPGSWTILLTPPNVQRIAAGATHTLLLLPNGQVWAAGQNALGQLGDGTLAPKADFQPVPGLPEIVDVAAGVYSSLALDRDGNVWTWGSNWTSNLPASSAKTVTRPQRTEGLPAARWIPPANLRAASGWADAWVVENEPASRATITLSNTATTVPPTAGSGTLLVTADEPWTASSSNSWLTVSPASGSANQSLTFTYTANAAATARFATIFVNQRAFTVTQASATAVFTPWGASSNAAILTLAGTGLASFGGDGNLAPQAALSSPAGVAVDPNGNVFIADTANHRIRRVDAATLFISTIAGTGTAGFSGDDGPATAAQLNSPSGITVDRAGNVYFSDSANNRIRRIDAVTQTITSIAVANAQVSRPMGLALDAAGNLFVADSLNHRIRKIAADATTVTTVAGNGTPGFSGNNGPAAGAQLNSPSGVALDAAGNLFLADTNNSAIRRIDAVTQTITTLGGNGTPGFSGDGGLASLALLNQPIGIAADPDGNLLIADTNNDRIRRIDASSQVITTIAGSGISGFLGDGAAATLARIYSPNAVAFDGAGGVYIADTVNNRIRFVDFSTPAITLSPTAAAVSAAAGSGVLNITTVPAGALWLAVSNSPWLTLSASSGYGSATLNFTFSTNSASSTRSATITVNDKIFPVNQAAPAVTLSASSVVLPPPAASGSFQLSISPAAAWTAVSSDPWLTVTPANGNGDQTINYSVSANAGSVARVATIRIAGKTFTVSQAALNGTYNPWGPSAYGTIRTLPQTVGGAAFSAVIDASGNLYFSDVQNNAVGKLSATTGVLTTVTGNGVAGFNGDGGPAAQASVYRPSGLALDSAGNLYIADAYNCRIRKVTTLTGIISTFAGTGVCGFAGDGGPASAAHIHISQGIAIDSSNNVYIADSSNHRIRKVDALTGIITTFAGTGTEGFSGDGGLAINAQLANPIGLAFDPAGNLFIGDVNNNRVRKISLDGTMSTVAGTGLPGPHGDGGQATAATLSYPSGVAIDHAANLYISEFQTSRVRKVNLATGIISTFAGTGTAGLSGDGGPAALAQIHAPQGVAVDGAGNLYIADFNNNRVRFVDLVSPSITLAPTSLALPPTAFSSTFTIDTAASTSWSASATATWLSIPTPSGSGPATVSFSAATNATGLPRTAEIRVNGTAITVTQSAATATVSPSAVVAPPAASIASVTLTLSAPVAWNAVSSAPWLTINPASGTGSQLLSFSLSPNTTTSARLATVSVAGTSFAVTQASPNGSYTPYPSAGLANITTIAGSGIQGSSGDGLPALQATLNRPSGILVDPNGNLFISHFNRIRRVDAATGRISTVAGTGAIGFFGEGGPASLATVNFPRGMALDLDGSLIFADLSDNRVRRIDATTGILSTLAGDGAPGLLGDGGPPLQARLRGPQGVAVDAAGNIYIADTDNHSIRKIDRSLNTISTIAGNGFPALSPTQLNSPSGLFVDRLGNLTIADTSNHRILRLPAGSTQFTVLAGNGTPASTGDGGPAVNAGINSPNGVALDLAGNIYFVESASRRVRKITAATGLISTIAGTGAFGATGDGGPATAATFDFPTALALDAAANLYIADTNNHKIRFIDFTFPTLTFSPASATAPASGASGSIAVSPSLPFFNTWTVTGAPAWLTISITNNTVNWTAAPNPSAAPRSASLLIGTAPFSLTQSGAAGSVTLSAIAASAPSPGASGTITVTPNPPDFASWTVSGAPAWLTVAIQGNTVTWTAAPNTAEAARSAALSIGNQTFNLTQDGTSSKVPRLLSITPSSSATATQSFTITVADANGAADLTRIYFLVNTTPDIPANSCHGFYDRLANAVFLYNDPLTALSPNGTNSQCAATGSATASGDNLTLTLNLTRQGQFASGLKNLYLWLSDTTNNNTGWLPAAAWALSLPPNQPPAIVSSAPPTSTAASQLFSVTARHPNGFSLIGRIYFQLGDTATPSVNGCHGFYDRAANQFFLFNDALNALAPTPRNSQCAIDTAASTATSSGLDITLALSLSRFGAYAVGPKNLFYFITDSNGANSGWVPAANWAIPAVPPTPPSILNASPSTASAVIQSFTVTARDPNGSANIGRIYFQLGDTSTPTANPYACHGFYDRASNRIYLFSRDLLSLSQPLTPGATGSASNSVCQINGGDSQVSISELDITLTLSLERQSTYGQGVKNLYFLAKDNQGADSPWFLASVWTLPISTPSAATITSATPSASTSVSQTFLLSLRDLNTYLSITNVLFVVVDAALNLTNGTPIPPNSCYGTFTLNTNPVQLSLYTDNSVSLLPSLTPGANGIVQNGQCAVNAALSKAAGSGFDLNLELNLTRLGAFAGGNKRLYYWILDGGSPSGWRFAATWNLPAVPAQPPILASVSPASSTFVTQTFTAVASDPNGIPDIQRIYFLVDTSTAIPGYTCHGYYDRAANHIRLYNDGLNGTTTPLTPGQNAAIQNSQCAINGAATSAVASGNTLSLNLSITRLNTFANGTRNVYFWVADMAGANTGWILGSAWNLPGSTFQPPALVSVTPSVSTTPTQTFAITAREPSGNTNLQRIYFHVGTNSSVTPNSCHGFYDRAANQVFLYNDALTALSPNAANSQCAVNTAQSSASASGTDLTLNLSLTRLGAFANGDRTLYLFLANNAGAVTGWLPPSATWSLGGPQPPTLAAASPGSATAPTQAFSITARDPNGFADIQRIYFLVNTDTNIPANSCHGFYDRAANQFFVYNDALTGPAPGNANSQCALNTAQSSASASGTDLILNLNITRLGAFATGTKTLYIWIADNAGATSGWLQASTWVL